MDSRAPRDGRSVEVLGHYNPRAQPETMTVDRERLSHWLERGARPSETVRTLLVRHRVGAGTEAESVAAMGRPHREPRSRRGRGDRAGADESP